MPLTGVFERLLEFLHVLLELFHLLRGELSEVVRIQLGELVKEFGVGFHRAVLKTLEGLFEFLGELLFLSRIHLVGVFRKGFQGVPRLIQVALKVFQVRVLRFFKAVGRFQRGVAEPILLLLSAQLFEALFHFLDVFLINHRVLGKLFELRIEL